METLNTFEKIARDIKCDHKCSLASYLSKELENKPNGKLPIYIYKFTVILYKKESQNFSQSGVYY